MIEFVNYAEGYVLYYYRQGWYKVPFFVLEDFSNEFFLEWHRRPSGVSRPCKSGKLRKLLSGHYNNHRWNSSGPSAGLTYTQLLNRSTPTIRLFKILFCQNIQTDFKAYQLFTTL